MTDTDILTKTKLAIIGLQSATTNNVHEQMLVGEAVELLTDQGVEIERLRALVEWQPIETAPKDGTWIILANLYSADSYYHIAWPTHWKPIGPPPWNAIDGDLEGHYEFCLAHPDHPESSDD